MTTDPDSPEAASPVRILATPERANVEAPVLIVASPDFIPADVPKERQPLPVVSLPLYSSTLASRSPPPRLKEPPAEPASEFPPALKDTWPPDMVTIPAGPSAALPVPRSREPGAVAAEPVLKESEPLLAVLLSPVVIDTRPLAPTEPATDWIDTCPQDPLAIEIDPLEPSSPPTDTRAPAALPLKISTPCVDADTPLTPDAPCTPTVTVEVSLPLLSPARSDTEPA
jgi:hypothetical protein